MSGRKLDRQRPPGSLTRRNLQVVIAVGIVLSLFAAWTLLASSGALDSIFRQKGKRGRTVSTASFNSNSPSKEYIYAGGRLVATEEPASSGCGSPPPSPGNTLVATAQTANSVLLNWAVSSGADHYEVQRRQNITSAWAPLIPNPTTNSLTDNGVVAGTTYLYQVRAVDAAGACPSAYSNVDLATTVVFTDDPLVAQVTPIRAVHVTQLRTAVNAVRTTANLQPASWTDDPLQSGMTVVKATHIEQLRTKLDEALFVLGFTTGGYTDSPLATGASGTNVKKVHIDQLRQRVK